MSDRNKQMTLTDSAPADQENPRDLGVCLASMRFYPLYGGPVLRFQRYAPGLAKRGVKISVFTQAITPKLLAERGTVSTTNGSSETSRDSLGEWPLFEIVDGIPILRTKLPSGWRHKPAFFRRVATYCQQLRRDIDVLHFNSLDKWAIPWLGKIRRFGIPTVYTNTMVGNLSSHPVKRALQRLDRRVALNLVDRVVVSSSVMLRDLERLGVSTQIEVIPNGVDLDRFRPIEGETNRALLRHKLALGADWEIVLAIGPIIPRKGVDTLVDAFARISRENPNAHLVLVGPRHDLSGLAPAGFHDEIYKLISDANAQDRVHFTGPVSNVQDYLRAADLLVFPSHREGMPNVVPEAMACGIPIIMTPFLGLPEEFGMPGTHYVLSSWEPEGLASDIRSLLSSSEHRRNLGDEGRHWVERKLDVKYSLDRYASMYFELAGRCGVHG